VPYRDLGEFVADLEKEGELHRIKAEVSADLEISEIADRVVKSEDSSKALLFEKVKGSKHPLIINTFGSQKRMRLALDDRDPRIIGEEVVALVKSEVPRGIVEKMRSLGKLREILSYPPKPVSRGECQEVEEKPDIGKLPVIKCWPMDAGRYITFPLVFTHDPETGERNCGVYRMQVYDSTTCAMHWQIHKHGASHYHKAKKLGKKLEVAVVVGSDPATMFSGVAPTPEGLDEMLLSGFIRKKGVEMVGCKTIDVEVPGNSEFVLEGFVDPNERLRVEGPFGDHTGHYSLAEPFPVFHATHMTRKESPIYVTTIVGVPPQEDAFLGKAIERMFLPLIQLQVPEVVDINLPVEGGFNNLAVVAIRKRYPGQARKVMVNLWGLGQMMFTKVIIVLDDDVNVHDMSEVLWATLARMDPKRDMMFLDNFPTDTLDHASPLPNLGSHVGIDATAKMKEEGFDREWPPVIEMDEATKALVEKRWKEYGLDARVVDEGAAPPAVAPAKSGWGWKRREAKKNHEEEKK
jgi:4-hydroxy-3-polyprenylbenzoate decarboxylase